MTVERPAHWPLKASPTGRDPAHWDAKGRLNADGVRELGRLVREGCGPREIARRTGMSQRAVSHRSKQIALALRVPTPADRIEARQQSIVELHLAGQSRKEIAAKLGIARSRVDQTLHARGLTVRRVAALAPADEKEIERRILLGHPLVEIARDISSSVAVISVRSRRLRAAGAQPAVDPRLCGCGWTHGHRGRCKMSPTDIEVIRSRLREGASMGMIANELGRRLSAIERHGKPILEQMAAEGVLCACGKPRGHRFTCTAFPSAATLKLRADVAAGLEAGKTRSAIARELGRDPSTICGIANPILDGWAAEGRKCGCGKPINHGSSCAARAAGKSRQKRGLGGLPIEDDAGTQRRILYRLGRGWLMRHIAHDLGVRLASVQIVADAYVEAAEAAGRALPDCRCGLEREHDGRCKTKPRAARFSYNLDKRTVQLLRVDYRLGRSVAKASRLRDVGQAQIAGIFEHWSRTSRAKVRPCACGLPARHPGFCSATTRHQVPKRLLARIDPMIRAGATVSEVAAELRLSFMTVSARSAEAREDLIRRGVTCACGRPLGHPYWCSATWDRFQMPRGHLPLETKLVATIKKALIVGDLADEISSISGVGLPTVYRLRRELSADELRQRRSAMRQRFATTEAKSGEQVFARIGRAVAGADVGYREDIRNDIYLAVMEGRIEVEQIEEAAGRMIKRAWWKRSRLPAQTKRSERTGRGLAS